MLESFADLFKMQNFNKNYLILKRFKQLVLECKEKRPPQLTLRKMSLDTGICVEDLTQTLKQLDLLLLVRRTTRNKKQSDSFGINLNSPIIDEYQTRLANIPAEKRQLLTLDSDCLIWSPYISHLMVSAAANFSIETRDIEVQTAPINEAEEERDDVVERVLVNFKEEIKSTSVEVKPVALKPSGRKKKENCEEKTPTTNRSNRLSRRKPSEDASNAIGEIEQAPISNLTSETEAINQSPQISLSLIKRTPSNNEKKQHSTPLANSMRKELFKAKLEVLTEPPTTPKSKNALSNTPSKTPNAMKQTKLTGFVNCIKKLDESLQMDSAADTSTPMVSSIRAVETVDDDNDITISNTDFDFSQVDDTNLDITNTRNIDCLNVSSILNQTGVSFQVESRDNDDVARRITYDENTNSLAVQENKNEDIKENSDLVNHLTKDPEPSFNLVDPIADNTSQMMSLVESTADSVIFIFFFQFKSFNRNFSFWLNLFIDLWTLRQFILVARRKSQIWLQKL